jgi:hypothetical protein
MIAGGMAEGTEEDRIHMAFVLRYKISLRFAPADEELSGIENRIGTIKELTMFGRCTQSLCF